MAITNLATGPLREHYELGKAAALRHEPKDAHPRYRRGDRLQAWVRGWNEGDQARLEADAFLEERARR